MSFSDFQEQSSCRITYVSIILRVLPLLAFLGCFTAVPTVASASFVAPLAAPDFALQASPDGELQASPDGELQASSDGDLQASLDGDHQAFPGMASRYCTLIFPESIGAGGTLTLYPSSSLTDQLPRAVLGASLAPDGSQVHVQMEYLGRAKEIIEGCDLCQVGTIEVRDREGRVRYLARILAGGGTVIVVLADE